MESYSSICGFVFMLQTSSAFDTILYLSVSLLNIKSLSLTKSTNQINLKSYKPNKIRQAQPTDMVTELVEVPTY